MSVDTVRLCDAQAMKPPMNALRKLLTTPGITVTDLRVLSVIADGGYSTHEAIGRAIGVKRPNVTVAIHKLLAVGALLRLPNQRGYELAGGFSTHVVGAQRILIITDDEAPSWPPSPSA